MKGRVEAFAVVAAFMSFVESLIFAAISISPVAREGAADFAAFFLVLSLAFASLYFILVNSGNNKNGPRAA